MKMQDDEGDSLAPNFIHFKYRPSEFLSTSNPRLRLSGGDLHVQFGKMPEDMFKRMVLSALHISLPLVGGRLTRLTFQGVTREKDPDFFAAIEANALSIKNNNN